MKRVCCLGTSHIGAVKGGWDAIAKQWPDVALTFFGAPNLRVEESLQFLKLEGRHIVPTDRDVHRYFHITSGGLTRIDLDAYDAFVVVGGVGLTKPFDLYTFYRTDEQAHAAENVLVSADCLTEAFAGIFRATYTYRLCVGLHQLTKRPVLLLPDPRPSEALLASEGSDNLAWDFYIKLIKQMHANGDHRPEASYFKAALKAICQHGVTVVDTPDDLVVNSMFTPHRYCRDSVWLQNETYELSPNDDYFHMNQDFGARVLTDVLSRL